MVDNESRSDRTGTTSTIPMNKQPQTQSVEHEATLNDTLALMAKVWIVCVIIGAGLAYGAKTYITHFPLEQLPMCPSGLSIIADLNDGGTVKCVK